MPRTSFAHLGGARLDKSDLSNFILGLLVVVVGNLEGAVIGHSGLTLPLDRCSGHVTIRE
jgi:hypothetical protein